MTPPKGPRGASEPPLEPDAGPLALVEDEETGDRLLVYRAKDEVRAELRVETETFWATQGQMAMMFAVTSQNISTHIKNIFAEGELSEAAVCKEFLRTGRDGKRYPTKLYDLNAVIAVGYRVGGPMGTMFRIWATDKLFQYLNKGFVIDERRMKNPHGLPDHFEELLETIRDIRSSESNFPPSSLIALLDRIRIEGYALVRRRRLSSVNASMAASRMSAI